MRFLPTATRLCACPIDRPLSGGAHFISVRGDGGGLSFAQARRSLVPATHSPRSSRSLLPAAWIPLLDDATFAIAGIIPWRRADRRHLPHFTTMQGQVITLIAAFHSTVLDNTRAIYAYLPPTYIENTEATLPVVYMHDGQNLWAAHPEWALGGVTWQVDTAFDNAANNGTFKEAIVIGVESNSNESTNTLRPSTRASSRRRRGCVPADARAGTQAGRGRHAAYAH
jgi:hypothetical protein